MKSRICETCHLPIPEEQHSVPCSEHHIRCIRCGWPVAKYGVRKQRMIDEDGICNLCKGKKD